MAIKNFLRIMDRGKEKWNLWRKQNPTIVPDLTQYDLSESHLSGYDLSGSNLQGASLRLASLTGANLRGANLKEANLGGAGLMHADLTLADLRGAHLPNAFFNEAELFWADFTGAYLPAATFTNAKVGWTVFGATNLSTVVGLDTVHHNGPSTIGLDTVYLSGGNIPENFLLGAGVRKEFMKTIRMMAKNPIKYFSCFISYSSADIKFVKRLYDDLINTGVTCWYSDAGLLTGQEYPDQIVKVIQDSDKVLVVLSKNSLKSEWVAKEVKVALEKEHKFNQPIIYPIKLDETVKQSNISWVKKLLSRKHFSNFTNYARGDKYRPSLRSLVSSLEMARQAVN